MPALDWQPGWQKAAFFASTRGLFTNDYSLKSFERQNRRYSCVPCPSTETKCTAFIGWLPCRQKMRTKQVIQHLFVRIPYAGAVLRRQYHYAYRMRAPCFGANTTTHTVCGRRASAPIPLRIPYAGAVLRRQYHYAYRTSPEASTAKTAYETGCAVSFRTQGFASHRDAGSIHL